MCRASMRFLLSVLTNSKAYSRSEREPWEPYLSKCINTCFCWRSCTSSTEVNTDCPFCSRWLLLLLLLPGFCLNESRRSPLSRCVCLTSLEPEASPTSKESLTCAVSGGCAAVQLRIMTARKRSLTQNWAQAAGKVLDFGLGTRLHCVRWLLRAAESQGESCV